VEKIKKEEEEKIAEITSLKIAKSIKAYFEGKE
jgi:hypothetical protein